MAIFTPVPDVVIVGVRDTPALSDGLARFFSLVDTEQQKTISRGRQKREGES
jgi:hypothetical protein